MSQKVDTFLAGFGIKPSFGHYGIFGMKWGESRTAEEIQAENAKLEALKKDLDEDEANYLKDKLKAGWKQGVDDDGKLYVKANVKSQKYKDFKNESSSGFVDMRGDGQVYIRRSATNRKIHNSPTSKASKFVTDLFK